MTAGPGANQVSFKFTNSGPSASSITDVYFDDGRLRIGIHVQGYSSGGSESFVNVPEPALGLLLAFALLGGGWIRNAR